MLWGCAGASPPSPPARAFNRDEPALPALPASAQPDPAAPAAALPAAPTPGRSGDAATDAAPTAPPGHGAAAASPDPARPEAAGDRTEAALRHAVATAADPTEPTLALVAELTSGERHDEALAVLDGVLTRRRNAVLRIARAGVLRDLGQRHLAVAELRALRRDEGVAALHPSLLFELAELEWLEGDAAAASTTLQALSGPHAADPWTLAQREAWQALAAAVARGGTPTTMRARDLLGNLRGAPLASERLAVLEQLHATGTGVPAHDELRQRALAIAAGDTAEAVRARAVQLATPEAEWAEDFVRSALDDASPLVRRMAASRAVVWLGERATPALFAALASEREAVTFLAIHAALAEAFGTVDDVDAMAVASADGRAAVLARWRTRLSK